MLSGRRVELVTAAVAVLLAALYLVLPPLGSDLSAQVARAGFFAGHGWAPVDLRWYGGVNQFGYSLVSQPVMALLGVRVTGAVALVLTAVTLSVLLRRTGAARPLPASLLGAVVVAGNLVSGRVTYGLGVLFGVAALLALTYPRLRWAAGAGALLASATSPVCGLFLGLAGVALLAAGRTGPGLTIAVPAALPLALTAGLFGDGGWMNISRANAVQAITTSLAVALLVPLRAVRAGAVLSALGVLAAALVHTPVGLNATRLVTMFALPVLAGYAVLPGRRPAIALTAVLAAVCFWQPPVVVSDVRDLGNPTADPAFFAPLRDRLARETLTGRVEVPPTRDYWEAARLGDVPLARGWLRQADIDRNPLFFTTVPGAAGTGVALTADSYRAWLTEQAVQFVAVPDAEFSWPGRAEAALVRAGLPYLTRVWSGPGWTLYAVADPQPIVTAPAALAAQSGAAVTLDVPAAGDVVVRVRHHRWLTATGGAGLAPAAGGWTRLRVPAAGRYTVSSALFGQGGPR